MRFELKEVSICAEKEFELIRITDPVREFVAQTGVKNGVVYVKIGRASCRERV